MKRRRVAFVLVVLLHVGLVSSLILNGERFVLSPFSYDGTYCIGPGADFYSVYHAAHNMREGLSPYTSQSETVTPYYYPYRYLPALAFVSQALTIIPPKIVYMLWIFVMEALLFFLILRLRSFIGASFLLLSTPYFLELYMGQFTFAATALALLAVTQIQNIRSKIALMFSVFLKPFTVVVLPVFLFLKRGWWSIACATLAILLSAPYFFRHPDAWDFFKTTNLSPSGGLGTGNYGTIELLFLTAFHFKWDFLLNHWVIFTQVFRITVMFAALIFVLSRRTNPFVSACVLLLAHFFSYAHVWEHHISAVILIGVWMLNEKNKQWVMAFLILLALPTAFYWLHLLFKPRAFDLFLGWPVSVLTILVLPKVLGTAGLLWVGVQSTLKTDKNCQTDILGYEKCS